MANPRSNPRRIPPKRRPTKTKKPPVVCAHLGAETRETIAVTCTGCNGKKTTRHYAVATCAIFGECLPAYRCTPEALAEAMTRDVAVCRGCQFNPSLVDPAAGAPIASSAVLPADASGPLPPATG